MSIMAPLLKENFCWGCWWMTEFRTGAQCGYFKCAVQVVGQFNAASGLELNPRLPLADCLIPDMPNIKGLTTVFTGQIIASENLMTFICQLNSRYILPVFGFLTHQSPKSRRCIQGIAFSLSATFGSVSLPSTAPL